MLNTVSETHSKLLFTFVNTFLRWFDKSFQLIIDGNAEAALHFEHSWGDGVAVMRFFNEIHEDTIKQDYQPAQSPAGNVIKHAFNIDEGMKNEVSRAQDNFDKSVARLKFNAQEIEGIGKKLFKTKKVSPDSVMQLAFQVSLDSYMFEIYILIPSV